MGKLYRLVNNFLVGKSTIKCKYNISTAVSSFLAKAINKPNDHADITATRRYHGETTVADAGPLHAKTYHVMKSAYNEDSHVIYSVKQAVLPLIVDRKSVV